VLSVQFAKGQTVKHGDALIALDDRTIQDAERQADADVRAAQAGLDQVQEPAQAGIVALARAGITQARAELDAAQRAADDAQRALDSPQDLSSQLHVWAGKVSTAQAEITRNQAMISDLQNQIQLAAGDQSQGGKARLAVLQKQAESAQAGLVAAQANATGSRQVLDLYQALVANPLDLVAAQHAAANQVKVAAAGLQVAQAALDIAQRAPQAEAVALAQAKLDAARANRDLAQAQAQHFAIASPLDGSIIARNIEPGETAQPGVPLLTVADTSELEITLYVPIRQLPALHVGQAVTVRLPSLTGKTFAGKLDYVASAAEFKPANVYNSQDRSEMVFQVHVKVPNPNGTLKAGLPADVTFQ